MGFICICIWICIQNCFSRCRRSHRDRGIKGWGKTPGWSLPDQWETHLSLRARKRSKKLIHSFADLYLYFLYLYLYFLYLYLNSNTDTGQWETHLSLRARKRSKKTHPLVCRFVFVFFVFVFVFCCIVICIWIQRHIWGWEAGSDPKPIH